jgi:hypothetical protein
VSALVESDEAGTHEVWAADVVVALAKALANSFDPVACSFTTADRPGLLDATGTKDTIGVEGLDSADEIPEPEAIRRLYRAGVPVLITNVQGLLGGEAPRGTRLQPAE